MLYALIYDYVADIAERRGPFRPEHLALVEEFRNHGDLVAAGALTEPLDGALFIFRGDSPARVEEFIDRDPYVAADLVTPRRIRTWTVVSGELR